MAEYKECEVLKKYIRQYTPNINGETTIQCVERAIDEAPISDVVEVKTIEQLKWERDTAIEQLRQYGVGLCEDKELAEVKHGCWLPDFETFVDEFERESEPVQTGWVCSLCGRQEFNAEPYCHCGAKMDGKQHKDATMISDRERLINLMSSAGWNLFTDDQSKEQLADFLIANGVMVKMDCKLQKGE